MQPRHAVALALLLAAASPLAAQGNGLKGEYYSNTGLSGVPAATRTDPALNFTWGGAPATGVPGNYFSVRWTGKLEAPVTGAYRIATYSSDGVRVWLNGTRIINNWMAHARTLDTSDPINLTAGQKYDLKVEFYDNTSVATIDLLWSYPGQSEVHIPKARLYSDPVSSAPAPVYLSEWTPTTAVNGWGPYEKDRSNGESRARDGQTITLGGVRYSRGLGVHARSELEYQLDGRYRTFLTDIGVDDEVGARGSVYFEVWVDGARRFASPLQRGYGVALPVTVDVTNARRLKLSVKDAEDGDAYDHADWAGARVVAASVSTSTPTPIPTPTPTPAPVPAVPTGLTATPGNAQVTLSWNAVSGATGYHLFRSTTSGVQGAQIGTGLTSTAFVNTGLTNGTTYFYSVAAVNASGSSAARPRSPPGRLRRPPRPRPPDSPRPPAIPK